MKTSLLSRALSARKRKIFALFFALAASIGLSWADTYVTITQNDFPQYGRNSFTKDGVTVSVGSIDSYEGLLLGGGSFSTTLGNFTKIEVNAGDVWALGEGWSGDDERQTWTGNASSVSFSGDINGMGQGVTIMFTIGDPAPTYTIALKDGTVNADKVTLSATSAAEGATVTVTPDDEYEITAFSAYYVVVEDQLGSIYEIDATLNAETGAYSFTMPAYAVTVEATIAAKPVPEGDVYAGFTATAGSGGFDNEGHANLVDNKFTSTDWTKWCTNDGHKSVPTGESESCWWIDFEASAALNPTGYILTTGNDTGSETGSNPKNWVLKAKLNADDAWTTIATVTNDVTMKNKSFKDYKFFVDQSGSYKYFRFEVFANQGANVMQLCQLRLIGTDTPANQLYMEVDGTAGTLKWGLAGSNPVYDGNAIQYSDRKYITTLTIDESCQNHTLMSFYNLFYVFKALTTINGIENLATANVESMRYMFYDCQSLTSLDLSSFNTANVTDMKGMFNGCSNLTTIYVGDGWNTSAVTEGSAMFYGCTNLPNYDSDATGVDKAYVGAGGYLSANLTPADVMALIAAIGDVEYTAESKAKIDAARAAYDALSAADKDLVTNIATLTQAETDYAALAAAAAAPVIAQIEALPTTIKLSTYFSTYDLMVAARAAYNTLSAEVQAAVTNLSKLTNLEAAFAAIGGVNEKLSKPFSVGEDQVVYFSHGNLQAIYNGTNWSWAFAAHQYEYIGDASGNIIINGNGTLSGAGTVDLFGWVANSSTVLTSGVAKYGVSNSDNVSDYGLGTTETLKGDWGVAANDANIGGYNDWRILSKDEWVYLFKTRTDAASKYGYATVGGVNGVIIIPDAFTDPMKNKGNLAFRPQNVDKGYSTNVYTTGGDWEAMEAAGAVFMPAAGRRYGTTMTVNEGTGFYWSSTPMSYQASYFMGFMGSNVVPDNDRYRSHGLSVRLVSNNAPVASTPLDSALVVKDMIDALPSTITLEDACVKAINDAREAYNKLSEAAKGLLEEATIAKLTDAEAALTALNQAEADKVVAKINNIPSPVTLKLATRDSIESARAAYEALTADQKLLVPAAEYQKLTDAEAELATLNPGSGMPAGALSGKFTINADGDQISFAKGNLQATTTDLGETWTWGFAANQWDVIGNTAANNAVNGNKTVSANGTVDLFGWSTPTTYYGISNSKNNDYYSSEFREWGENITGAEWKTLNPSDWNYIIKNRADAADKHGQATVNGVNGYIFLPDEWELPSGLSFTAKPNNWTANVYDGDDWTAMENAGALFLPMSPWRSGNTVTTLTAAYYWTSDYNSSYMAMTYSFQEDASVKFTGINRYAGIPVRLATADSKGVTPLDSAQVVKDQIEAIPTEITLDDNCVKAIEDARAAYDALSEAAQGALDATTVQKLTDAEAEYAALKAGKDAADVTALINAIPNPVVYPDSKGAINDARTAYDALSDAAKNLINAEVLEKLTDAEADYAALLAAVVADVVTKINAIPQPVELKLATRDSIESARAAYDALTAEEKTAVSNYTVLTAAEAALAEKNQGGSAPVDIVWDINTGIESVTTGTTSPAYEGITITTGNGNRFYQTTQDPIMLRFFFTGSVGSYAFAKEDGSHITKVVLISSVEMSDWMINPSRIGTDWVVSDENKKATWIGDADTVKIWDGVGATSWVDVDSIVFTVSGTATPLDSAQAVKDLIEDIPAEITLDDNCVKAIEDARAAYEALANATKGALDDATVQKLTGAEAAFEQLIQPATETKNLIDAIGTVEFSPESKAKIVAAREAYDALSAAQRKYVPNLAVLTAAEQAYENSRPYATITTVPAAVEALQYTGAAHTLITAGAAEHGTVLYSLDGVDYSTELPTALFAGAYTIYYKVQATDDYKDVAPVTVIATIAYNYPATYGLFGIPEGWSVKVNDEEVAVVNGAVKNIAANDRFEIMPVQPEIVKRVEVVPYLLDLATVTDSVIYILDGDSITGTANGNISIVIVPDAKVYFKDVNLTNTGSHPAVLFGGNAEMVVVGENSITCTTDGEYGIRAAGAGTTLTISGDKTLLNATINPNGGTVNQ